MTNGSEGIAEHQTDYRKRRIEKALDDFYMALDEIATEQSDVVSTEWLPFVEGQIGSGGVMDGYSDWVHDAWEPLPGGEA